MLSALFQDFNITCDVNVLYGKQLGPEATFKMVCETAGCEAMVAVNKCSKRRRTSLTIKAAIWADAESCQPQDEQCCLPECRAITLSAA